MGKKGLLCCNFISLPFKKSTRFLFLQTHSVCWELLQLLLVFKYHKCHVWFLHRTAMWLHMSIYMYRLASRIHYPSMLFVNLSTNQGIQTDEKSKIGWLMVSSKYTTCSKSLYFLYLILNTNSHLILISHWQHCNPLFPILRRTVISKNILTTRTVYKDTLFSDSK